MTIFLINSSRLPLSQKLFASCPNAQIKSKADRGRAYVEKWASIYLVDAQKRLQTQMKGYELGIEDVYIFQQACAYEVRLIEFILSLVLSDGTNE